MRTPSVLGISAIVFLLHASAGADKLILKDGTVYSGTVSREKDTYSIQTDDGQDLSFPKGEVRKWRRESKLNDEEVRDKYEELYEVIMKALERAEPRQREFARRSYTRHHSERFGRGFSETSSGNSVVDGVERESVGSDDFKDKWVRYAVAYEAASKNPIYRKHTANRGKLIGSDSLREYAIYPPEGREELGESLKAAIEGFEKCIKLAKNTTGRLRGLENRTNQLATQVRRARNAMNRAKGDALEAAHATYDAVEAAKATRLARLTTSLDQAMNELAIQSELSWEQLATAQAFIANFSEEEVNHFPNRTAGATGGTQILDSDSVTGLFRRIVAKFRSEAPDMTTMGLDDLRARTLTEIEEIFVGRNLSMEVRVRDMVAAGRNRYALIPKIQMDTTSTILRRGQFHFGQDLKSEIASRKVGERIAIVVRIETVALEPNLASLEASDTAPGVSLVGDIVSVH